MDKQHLPNRWGWVIDAPEWKGVRIQDGYVYGGENKYAATANMIPHPRSPVRKHSWYNKNKAMCEKYGPKFAKRSKAYLIRHMGKTNPLLVRAISWYILFHKYLSREDTLYNANLMTYYGLPHMMFLLNTPVSNFNEAKKQIVDTYGKSVWRTLARLPQYKAITVASLFQFACYLSEAARVDRAYYVKDAPSAIAKSINLFLNYSSIVVEGFKFKGWMKKHISDAVKYHSAELLREEQKNISYRGFLRKIEQASLENASAYSDTPFAEGWSCTLAGVNISLLNSPRKIKLEGDFMKHCVGGYARLGETLRGEYLFFHLQSKDGHSTLQLGLGSPISSPVGQPLKEPENKAAYILQHYGKCNTPAPHSHKKAAEILLENVQVENDRLIIPGEEELGLFAN